MKEIPLTQGYIALIDDDDFEIVSKYKWRAYKGNNNVIYAITHNTQSGVSHDLKMHRLILKAPKNLQVDHINHNGIDNRKDNLRIVNNSQNHMNMRGKRNTSSVYKGVSFINKNKKWQSKIHHNGKTVNLGEFENEDYAAIAYNKMASVLFNKYAFLNKVPYIDDNIKIEIENAARERYNKAISRVNSSTFKGVTFLKNKNKWQAQIKSPIKNEYIGTFNSEIEAAEAYNNKAIEIFGDNANINKITAEEFSA